jgi:hypothetical protein
MESIMPSSFVRSRRNSDQASRPAIESLESRAYFAGGAPDLVVSLPGSITPTAISGGKFNGKIAVNVANDGLGKTSGPYTFTLFASTDTTLSSDDSQIYTVSRSLNVAVEKNKTFIFRVATLPVNLDGSYYVLAQVSGGQGSAVGASGGAIAITPAHIDLSDAVLGAPPTGHLGQKIPVSISVSNFGNIAATGTLDVLFELSSTSDGANPFQAANVSTHINIKPSTTKKLHLRVLVPLGASSGNQYIIATVDPSDVFNDTNLANNVAISTAPVSFK